MCFLFLRYVSDHAYDGYKAHCQRKLLQSANQSEENGRTYPPCLLEWKSNTRRTNMALEAKFADGKTIYLIIIISLLLPIQSTRNTYKQNYEIA